MYTPHLEVPNGTNSNIRLLQNEGSIEGRLLVGQRRCVRPPAGPLKSASIHPVHMTPTNPSLQEAKSSIVSESSLYMGDKDNVAFSTDLNSHLISHIKSLL